MNGPRGKAGGAEEEEDEEIEASSTQAKEYFEEAKNSEIFSEMLKCLRSARDEEDQYGDCPAFKSAIMPLDGMCVNGESLGDLL